MPKELRNAITGARAGEDRLYAAPGRAPSVVLVRDVIEGKPQAIENVTAGIQDTLTAEKRQKAFDSYALKRKAASSVKVMVSPAELRSLVGAGKAES